MAADAAAGPFAQTQTQHRACMLTGNWQMLAHREARAEPTAVSARPFGCEPVAATAYVRRLAA